MKTRLFIWALIGAGLILGYANLFYAAGTGRSLKVPQQFKTIQDAIDAANSGDTILVAAGVYKENIQLADGVILQGSGAEVTTIDGGGEGIVVEGAKGSVIEGFTITHSGKVGRSGDIMDVGISAKYSPMTIANCRIVGNNAGIRTYFSPSNIINNIIAGNKAYGIYILYSDSRVKNNLIYNNGSYGIYNSYSGPEIINNTITENLEGIYSFVSRVLVKNNIIATNINAGIHWIETPDNQREVEPVLSYNLVWGNNKDYINVSPGDGDISEDPMFPNLGKLDARLKESSPAIDKGDEDQNYSDPDGSRGDMGAYGGPLAQKALLASPEEVSYASLEILYEAVKDPGHYLAQSWGVKAKTGKVLFNGKCVPCHGPQGKGDGPYSLSEGIRPRDLSMGALLSMRTDEFLFGVIKNGGASVGFSEVMPPSGKSMSEEEIKNVVQYIRSEICKCQYVKESGNAEK